MIYNSFENTGLVKTLRFLQAHDTEYLSGQDLSDVLKISRVAVWKHIKRIQELGYVVESRQKLGYKLVSNSELLLPWEITANLKTKTIGQRAYYFDSLESTQNKALEMACDITNDGAVIIASEQTRGHGRSARRWVSLRGGIWLSVILRPTFDITITTLFPIASALALSVAIEKTLSIKPELKWPNDLTIRGKKVAGLLVDASLESNRIASMVLGVGINFDVDAKQIENSLKKTPNFYGAASLAGQGQKTRPIQLVQTFLAELEKVYNSLHARQTSKIISEWTLRSSTIGRDIELDTPDAKIRGRAIRIDEAGALLVSENNKTHRVIAGDILYLPK